MFLSDNQRATLDQTQTCRSDEWECTGKGWHELLGKLSIELFETAPKAVHACFIFMHWNPSRNDHHACCQLCESTSCLPAFFALADFPRQLRARRRSNSEGKKEDIVYLFFFLLSRCREGWESCSSISRRENCWVVSCRVVPALEVTRPLNSLVPFTLIMSYTSYYCWRRCITYGLAAPRTCYYCSTTVVKLQRSMLFALTQVRFLAATDSPNSTCWKPPSLEVVYFESWVEAMNVFLYIWESKYVDHVNALCQSTFSTKCSESQHTW